MLFLEYWKAKAVHINCSPKFRKKFQLKFLVYVFVVFKLFRRWFYILPYLSNIFHMKKFLWMWWSSQGFFWFLKANGWFTNDIFDHFQQENKLTVLCQWFLSLIISFKLNDTFCRIFFSQNLEELDWHKGTSFLFRNKMRLLPQGLSSPICLMYMLCE